MIYDNNDKDILHATMHRIKHKVGLNSKFTLNLDTVWRSYH